MGERSLNHDWLLIVRLLEEFHPHMQVSGPAHCSRKSVRECFTIVPRFRGFGHLVRPFAAEGSQVSGTAWPPRNKVELGHEALMKRRVVATRPEIWPPRRPREWCWLMLVPCSLPSSIHAMVA